MTRLTAALVAAALLLPTGARARDTAVTHGFDQCPQGWICGDSEEGLANVPLGLPGARACEGGNDINCEASPELHPDHSWHLLIRRSDLTKQECEDWRDDFKGNADASAECFQ